MHKGPRKNGAPCTKSHKLIAHEINANYNLYEVSRRINGWRNGEQYDWQQSQLENKIRLNQNKST